jgi:hypothetical protein
LSALASKASYRAWRSGRPERGGSRGWLAGYFTYFTCFTFSPISPTLLAWQFTVSGTPNDGDIIVEMDGQPFDWRGAGTLDRTFYTFGDENAGLPAGEHTITYRMGTPPGAGEPSRSARRIRLLNI